MMKNLKNMVNTVKNIVKKAAVKFVARQKIVQVKLAEDRGDFTMDHAVVYIIIVVLAGIVLGILTGFIKVDFAEALKAKILGLFSL